MSTRCKPGDIAFFRKGDNVNKFVSVLAACNPGLSRMIIWRDRGAYWLVESRTPVVRPCGHVHGTMVDGKYRDFVPDDLLTPLRDLPGQDETLTWAGKREGLPAPPELVS